LLVAVRAVKVKMLPYDDKSELQVIVDMDEGTTLERSLHVAQEIAPLATSLGARIKVAEVPPGP